MDRTGILSAIGAALAFSSLSVVGKLAPEAHLNPNTLLFWRFALASLVLLLISRKTLLPAHFPALFRWPAFVLGLIYTAQTTLYFLALGHLSAGTTSLVLYLTPALVLGLQAWAGLKPSRLQMAAVGCALLGVTVLAGNLSAQDTSVQGWLLVLASAVCYALYLFLGGRWLAASPALPATAISTFGTACGLGLLGLVTQQLHVPTGTTSWTLIGLIMLFPTVLALPAVFFATAKLGSGSTALLLTLEPVFVLLLGTFLLHEPVGLAQMLGGLLILLGAGMASWTGQQKAGGQVPRAESRPQP
ncbi:DMT family transporter [Deinococcus roseus]|uniref:Membrane protein n=1 Tax=Deinococcus roseus TaxID=392414 RepID=A0ABQ2D051_9DEIO|nr:DMT family transporter [Deinococcus roseus]GGJ36447.1 membrane protein [Deinococcus roseus]